MPIQRIDAPAMDDETKTNPVIAEAMAALDTTELVEAGLANEDGKWTLAGLTVASFLSEVDWLEVMESDDEDVVDCIVQEDYGCVIEGEGDDATLIPMDDLILSEDEDREPDVVLAADVLEGDAATVLVDLDDLSEMFCVWLDEQSHETLEEKARDAAIYQALNEEPRPWKKGDFKKKHGSLGPQKVNRMLGAMIRKGAIKRVQAGKGYGGGDYAKVGGQYPGVKKAKVVMKGGKAEAGGLQKWANWIAKHPTELVKKAQEVNKESLYDTDVAKLKARLATLKKNLPALNKMLKKAPDKSKKHISLYLATILAKKARSANKVKGAKASATKKKAGAPKGGPKGLAASDTTSKPATLSEGARLAAGIGKVMGGRAPSGPVTEAKMPTNEQTGAKDSMTRKSGAALAGHLVESHRAKQPKSDSLND